MNQIDYQKLLFETAMLVMVCDGEISESEIEEIKLAFAKNVLFGELDFAEELADLTTRLGEDKKGLISGYFDKVENGEFDPVQRLQILEIALRIMYADDRIEENEVRFVRLLKTRLGVMDEILRKRFGEVEFLFRSSSLERAADTPRAFASEIEIPDFGDLLELPDQRKP